ncbi:MAG: polysaccharide deacetylase family protein [Rikenellaceae bacterium]|nr:polysaccharide deacetylase family protein [Rikenellaceae bacterium]
MKKILITVLLAVYGLSVSAVDIYVAKYRDDKEAAISYTFDDGLAEYYTMAAPELEKRGLLATFWINGSKINEDPDNIMDTTRMTWAQLKEMADAGHEISNHGWAHKNFGRHSEEEIREDIYKNDSAIFVNIGKMPVTFCYPNNARPRDKMCLATEGRVGTRTEQRSIGSKATPDDLEKWVETLIDNNDWGVGMTHGLTYGYDAFGNPDILWEHLDKVKEQEDRIWVGTFEEIAAYTFEQQNIKLDITEERNAIKIEPVLDLDKELFKEQLTMVVVQQGINRISVKQGNKNIPVKIQEDKVLFDFDPYGGIIEVKIK